jgi:hypothetical protein
MLRLRNLGSRVVCNVPVIRRLGIRAFADPVIIMAPPAAESIGDTT